MNKNTYVVSTVYHIYLVILKMIKDNDFTIKQKQSNLLIITKNTEGIEELFNSFEDSLFFRRVILLPNIQEQNEMLGKFSSKLNKKKIVKILENNYEEIKEEETFISKSKIYIGDSDAAKNYFYFKYGKTKKFTMFEDGAGTYVNIPKRSKVLKKRILKNGFTSNGFGKEVEKVIAVKQSDLPNVLKNKSEALNIKEIVHKISDELKYEIFKTFNFTFENLLSSKPKILILGSTISEDSLVANENVKVNIFSEILESIDQEKYQVYFKPHPREKTIYNFKDVIYIPKLFPAELLTLDKRIKFDKGFAIISTALENLGDTITEKVYVFEKYKHFFTNNVVESSEIVKKYS